MPTTGIKTDTRPGFVGLLYLEIDDWEVGRATLEAASWNFLTATVARYDPTIITGALTPSGKICNATFSGNTASVTIAGINRQTTVAKTSWLTGPGLASALIAARNAFPANQR